MSRVFVTDFAHLPPVRARLTLIAFGSIAAFLVGITFSPWRSGFADAPNRGQGDVELYRAEIGRIQAGQSYYDAADAELRGRGYPVRSVFNWRTPLPTWLVGTLPEVGLGRAILAAAAIALALLAFALLDREGNLGQANLGVLVLTGALLPCAIGDLFVMPEVWCGILLAGSLAAYGTDRWRLGFALALSALFVRELAAPYCLLCVGWSLWGRRWREALAWTIGLAAYAAFYAWHLQQVLPRIAADDLAHVRSWIAFGGAGFVISTVQMNVYLLLLPQWVAALYLTAALVGFAGWSSPAGSRAGLSAVLYVAAFAIVGQPFNQYWGSVIAPLLCFGVARCPTTLSDLVAAARDLCPERRWHSYLR